MKNITDEQINNVCHEQSIKLFNLAVEDFVKTDIGFIDVIVPVYEQLSESTFDETFEHNDETLYKRIFDCLAKIDDETPDPDYDDPDSDFNKRCDASGCFD